MLTFMSESRVNKKTLILQKYQPEMNETAYPQEVGENRAERRGRQGVGWGERQFSDVPFFSLLVL